LKEGEGGVLGHPAIKKLAAKKKEKKRRGIEQGVRENSKAGKRGGNHAERPKKTNFLGGRGGSEENIGKARKQSG